MLVISIFRPFVFYVNESAEYIRTPFTYSYIVILVFYGIVFICTVFNSYIQIDNNYKTTALAALMVIMAIILRANNEQSNSDWLAISFALYITYEMYVNIHLRIDQKTGLLNSQAFSNVKSKIFYTTTFIVLDVNNLKRVNDTFGHKTGDAYLGIVGETILEVYGKIANCYRVGGDEFILFLKKGFHEKDGYNFNIHRTIKEKREEFDMKMENNKQKYEFLDEMSGVAQGYGLYIIKEERPDDYKGPLTIDEAIECADKMMYERKKEMKEIKTKELEEVRI